MTYNYVSHDQSVHDIIDTVIIVLQCHMHDIVHVSLSFNSIIKLGKLIKL